MAQRTFGHSAPPDYPTTSWQIGALGALLAARPSVRLENAQVGSGDRSMDPKRWRTEHTSIQGMSGLLELRGPCDHLTKKKLSKYEVPQSSGGRRAARRVPNTGHRTIRSTQTSQVEDRAKKPDDQEYVRCVNGIIRRASSSQEDAGQPGGH